MGRKKKSKSPILKKAARKIFKNIVKHLVQLPEEEREKDIAAFERAVVKKFKRLRKKK